MKAFVKTIFNLILLAATIGFSQDKTGLKLWYNKPSGDRWENALPIGSGRLGPEILMDDYPIQSYVPAIQRWLR